MLSIFFISQILGVFPPFYFNSYEYFYHHFPHIFYIGLPSTLLWAPSLFLYVKSITDPYFWRKRFFLLHIIPFLLLFIYFFIQFHIYNAEVKRELLDSLSVYNETFFKWLGIAVFLQVVGYNIASIISIKQYEKQLKENVSNINNEGIQWLKFIVYGYVITCFINLVIIKSADYLIPFNTSIISNLLFLTFFTVLFYRAFVKPDIFIRLAPKSKYHYSSLTEEEEEKHLAALEQYMNLQRAFLQANLTLKELAQKIGISERYLSQIINKHKGQNFYDYINCLRIEESKRILSSPNNQLNISQVLYKVGFNSKTAFYVTFKKHLGMTPSEFKKNQVDK